MSDLFAVDTAWCPVCDRAILPKRIQVPVPVPDTLPTLNQLILPSTKSKTSSTRSTKYGGLVHGTGRGLRRLPPPSHQKQSHLHQDDVASLPVPIKTRTVICQEIPYYCSEECRLLDLRNELDGMRVMEPPSYVPLTEEFDEPMPLRVPQNTPAEFYSPPSPHFLSSGTDSDSSSVSTSRSQFVDEPASYSATNVLRKLPPLTRKTSDPKLPTANCSGVIVAAQRIKQAFENPLQPPVGSSSPRKRDVVLPGWTDGDRTQWRSSVYGGAELVSNPDYRPPTNLDAFTGGSYSAQGARRAAGLVIDDFQSPRVNIGHSAPQPNSRILHDTFNSSWKRTNSSSNLSSDGGSPTEESIHPLLSNSLRGKLLVPHFVRSGAPSRNSSSTSLASSIKREPVTVKSPLSQNVQPSSERRKGKGERSWSYDGQLTYALPPRIRKEKQIQETWVPSSKNNSGIVGLGEGRWEKKEVEVEVEVPITPPKKRLFLFG